MACQTYQDAGCVSKKQALQAELAANNVAIAECDKIISAFDGSDGIFNAIDNCSSNLDCAINKVVSSVVDQSGSINFDNLKENKTVLNNYKQQLQAKYNEAVSNKKSLETSNAQLSAAISACGDCMRSTC